MQILRPLLASAMALAMVGCVSTSDFEAAQRQIGELQEELANIKRTAAGKEDVRNVNTRIAEQTETLLKSNATLVAKVAEIDERIATTQGGIESSTYRLDRVTQEMADVQRTVASLDARVTALANAAAAAPPPGTETTAGGGTASGGQMTVPGASAGNPNDTYQAAYRDYQKGNFDLAIEGFRDFLSAAPKSDLADNAAYWVGESLFSQKKYREAIAQFDSVVTNFPRSDKVAGALLKKGYSYISLGEKAQGVVQLQYVVHEHPQSPEAGLARQRLKQLGIDTK
jgi:tol-pal system protein YbgF